MLKRRNEKKDDSIETDLAKMQKLEATVAKKAEKERKKEEKAAKKAAKKAEKAPKKAAEKEQGKAKKSFRGKFDLKAMIAKRREFKESKKEIYKNSNGKKYKKIKTSIMVTYCIPVILIVILGIVSYETASDAVVDKYKTSASSAVTATKRYLEMICSDVQTKAASLASDDSVVRYYKTLYKKTDDSNAKKVYSNLFNSMGNYVKSTEYLADYYIIGNNGDPLVSFDKTEFERNAMKTVNFSQYWDLEEAAIWKDTSKANAWIANHPFIDENYAGDPSAYAFTYIQLFQKRDGVIVFDIEKESIRKTLSAMELGDGSIIGIAGENINETLVSQELDKDNTLVSNLMEDGTVVFREEDFYKETVSEATTDTTTKEVTYNGKDYCFLSSPIGETGMTVNALIPISTLVKDMSGIRMFTIIFVIIGAILALGTGTYIASGISSVLTKVCHSLRKVAGGDLTQRFETKRKDELRFLTDSLTETLTGIHELMLDVRGFGNDVGDSAKNVSGSSENIFATMQNVSSALEGVAEGVDSQAGDTETCAQLMSDFSDKMTIVQSNTKKITETVDRTLESTEKGRSTVAELNQKSSATTDVVKELVQEIKAVVTQSDSISGIIDAINDIAEQTNLLSLNASIEAARAGEQGRGFAVVAEEIRKLADDSMKAGNQIYKILDQIRVTTGKASVSAQKTNGFLEDQATVLTDTTEVFGSISQCVDEMVAVLSDIVSNINEMIQSKETIASSITNIAAVSQEVAVSTRTVSDDISEQLKTVEKLAAEAGKLNDKAKSLSDSMKRFTV